MSKTKNYIYVKEKSLSVDQCRSVVDYINGSRTKFAGHYFAIYDNIDNTPFQFIPDTVLENLKVYQEEHQFLKTLYAPWGLDRSWNLQKYLPGQAYHPEHMEHGYQNYDCRRLVAWMIYLNDVEDGGETYWPQQDFIKSARTGDLCIWPSGWTHSHYGIVSKTETKYVITGWCSFSVTDGL